MLAHCRSLAGFANQSFQKLVNRAEGLTQSPARRDRQMLPPSSKRVYRPPALLQRVIESVQKAGGAAFECSQVAAERRGADDVEGYRCQLGQDVEGLGAVGL